MEWLFIGMAMGIAALVQGATGFGFGLVALALLGNIVGMKEASIMITPASFVLNLAVLFKLRASFSFKGIWPILIGVAVATPVGVYFLSQVNPTALTAVLGFVLIITAAYNLVPHPFRAGWHRLYLGLPFGLFGGFLGGACV